MWTKVRLVNLFAFIGITFPIPIHHLILSGSTKTPIKVPYISHRLGLWQVRVTSFSRHKGSFSGHQPILPCLEFLNSEGTFYVIRVWTLISKRPNEVFTRSKIRILKCTVINIFLKIIIFFFLNSSFSAHFTLFPADGFSSNSKLTSASKVTKCDVIALISGDKRSINVIIKNSV